MKMDVKDIKKKMAERTEQFNTLVVKKAELEREISLINEELLRLQGGYAMLEELLPEEERSKK